MNENEPFGPSARRRVKVEDAHTAAGFNDTVEPDKRMALLRRDRFHVSVIVTGAAGFIGSHVTDALLTKGEEVVGVDSFDDFYARAQKERNLEQALGSDRFRLVEGDIRDGNFLDRLPDHADSIVHLAARAGVRPSIARPDLYAEVNVMGTARLLQLAKVRGIRTFVFASSSSVYGNNDKVPFSECDPVDRPISPYAATKRSGELLCHTSTHLDGITTLCLRFFTVYGPRQRPDLAIHKFTSLLDAGEPIPVYGDGSTSRDYTYIDDTVAGVTNALIWARRHTGRHEIVNLGNSRTIDLATLVRVLGEELETSPIIDRLPLQAGDVRRTYADIGKASSLFGYEPGTDFRTGIRRFIQWFHGARQTRSA